jgi:hypothetical protein
MRKRSEHKTTYGDGVLERSLCSIRLPFDKLLSPNYSWTEEKPSHNVNREASPSGRGQ